MISYVINKVKISIVIMLFILMSCEPKVYYPEDDSSRDINLVGTWRFKYSDEVDSSGLFVFTKEGFADNTYWVSNNQMIGFFDLGGLWYNIYLPDEKGIGKIYHASTSSSWQMRRWESNIFYKISREKDTLIIGSNYNTITDTLVWNDYQLIYNGAKYVGIDTLKNK